MKSMDVNFKSIKELQAIRDIYTVLVFAQWSGQLCPRCEFSVPRPRFLGEIPMTLGIKSVNSSTDYDNNGLLP